MFNNNVLNVLQQINGVTNSVILKYPTTVAVSDSQDMMINFDVSVVEADEFPDIPLKDALGDFLSLFKLFGDKREIEVSGSSIDIKDENIQSSFITHNAALMDAWDKSPEQFTKTESVPSVSTFDLGSEDIKNISAAMGVFKDLTEVIFTSQDGDMTISLGATNKFNAKSNTYSIRKPSNANKEFEIKIPVINFKSLPQTDYTVDVKYNSARDSYRILLTSKTLENFKVLMTVKI